MTEGDVPFLFLIGATGHTGSRVARRLLERGWRLRCLSHTPERRQFFPQDERLEIVAGDVSQPEPWQDALAGASALVHMAHVRFAPAVIAACREAGVERAISLSSTRRFTQFPEETAAQVIEGERAWSESGLRWTVLRPSMIYGGDRDNNIEKLVRWLRRRRWMPLVAGGRNLVQPIFVWDLVDAIERALARPEQTAERALTVAGPEAMTQRELIETVGRAMGRPPIWLPAPYRAVMSAAWGLERVGRRPLVTRAQVRRQLEDKVFDIGEARKALGGWQPRPFEEGIREKLLGRA